MRLVVGLGNPGEKYRQSLHNIGFEAIDRLVGELSLNSWKSKFNGLVINENYQGHPFLLLKPLTYMNLSGQSVQACAQFYKVTLPDTLVVSDDVDLVPGKIRYREKGGHGGHNGLRNIMELCGNDFHRLRIGVGRPDDKRSTADYVLGRPSGETKERLEDSLIKSTEYILDFISGRPIQIVN